MIFQVNYAFTSEAECRELFCSYLKALGYNEECKPDISVLGEAEEDHKFMDRIIRLAHETSKTKMEPFLKPKKVKYILEKNAMTKNFKGKTMPTVILLHYRLKLG